MLRLLINAINDSAVIEKQADQAGVATLPG
jgi:hypothetical protein